MSNKTAKIISSLFDPPVLAIIILFVSIIKSPMNQLETFFWSMSVVVLNGLIPLLFLFYFNKKGYIFDGKLDSTDTRRNRIPMLVIFLIAVTIEFLGLYFTRQYQPLMAVFTGGIISIALVIVITYYWKISLHAAMITFFVMMGIYLFGWNLWPIILLIPIVMWSRLVLKRHTIWQLLAGMILAFAVVTVTFVVYQII